MSTLEKTITLLNELPEEKIEVIYSYVKPELFMAV